MITTILSLLPTLLPALISIGGMIASWYFSSQANLKTYQDMVQKNKDSGLVTVDTAQKLADFHQQMATDYAALQKLHQQVADNHKG